MESLERKLVRAVEVVEVPKLVEWAWPMELDVAKLLRPDEVVGTDMRFE